MNLVKRYQDDPQASWEERYRALEKHHIEETQGLIKKLEEAKNLEKIDESLDTDANSKIEEIYRRTFHEWAVSQENFDQKFLKGFKEAYLAGYEAHRVLGKV